MTYQIKFTGKNIEFFINREECPVPLVGHDICFNGVWYRVMRVAHWINTQENTVNSMATEVNILAIKQVTL